MTFFDDDISDVVKPGVKWDYDLLNKPLWCFYVLNVVIEEEPKLVDLSLEHLIDQPCS